MASAFGHEHETNNRGLVGHHRRTCVSGQTCVVDDIQGDWARPLGLYDSPSDGARQPEKAPRSLRSQVEPGLIFDYALW